MAIDYTRINWKNEPNETTPLSAENLNKMDKAIDDLVTDVNSLEPNPVEEATEGLEKLAYGGTVYEVKGGHKIVNDNGVILAQKDNLKFGGVYSHNSGTITVVDTVREFNSVANIEALTGEEAKGFQYLDDDVYDAFTAGDIAFDNSDTSFVGTNVQDVLEEVDTKIDDICDTDTYTVPITPTNYGEIIFEKYGKTVCVTINVLKNLSANAIITVGVLPSNFRPSMQKFFFLKENGATGRDLRMILETNGNINVYLYSTTTTEVNVKDTKVYLI